MRTNASNDIEFLKAYDGLIKMFKADYPEYNNDEFRGVRRETTYTDTVLTWYNIPKHKWVISLDSINGSLVEVDLSCG